MFRFPTILRELVQSLAKVTLVKTFSKITSLCIVWAYGSMSAQQTAHTPFHDMLPHLHTIRVYNDVILLNVSKQV